MKKILLCVHGLMNHDDHDLNTMKSYLDDKVKKDEEAKLVYLYDHSDYHSYNYKRQYKVLDSIVKDYIQQGYEVNVLGFSFSCSLVAKLCKNNPINKIILVSPTIKLFGSKLLANYVKVSFKSFKMKWKYRHNKKAKEKMNKAHLNHVVDLLINVLKSMVKNKKQFKNIKCPCLVLKGTSDCFVNNDAVVQMMKMIKSSYLDCRFYENFTHTFIRHSDECQNSVYPLIYHFVFEK